MQIVTMIGHANQRTFDHDCLPAQPTARSHTYTQEIDHERLLRTTDQPTTSHPSAGGSRWLGGAHQQRRHGPTPTSTIPPGNEQAIRAQMLELPLSFEPNRGQTDATVSFLARGPGYGILLTPTEAVLTLRHA